MTTTSITIHGVETVEVTEKFWPEDKAENSYYSYTLCIDGRTDTHITLYPNQRLTFNVIQEE